MLDRLKHPVCPCCGHMTYKAPEDLIQLAQEMKAQRQVHLVLNLMLLRFGKWTTTARFVEELWEDPSREPKDPEKIAHLAIGRLKLILPPEWRIGKSKGMGFRLEKIK